MGHNKHIVFDNKLEGLRAICAITVAVAHIFNFKFFSASNSISNYLGFDHESVLIFFIISGYVIGLQHIQTPFNYSNAVVYLKKRALRLYPIYLLALLISFAIDFPANFSVQQFTGHLLFTQELWVNTISTNVALWSISYEVVYYILFLGLWMFGKHNMYTCLFLSIAILGYVAFSGPDLNAFKSVQIGWIFWMAGLYLAQQSTQLQTGNEKTRSPLISYFAVILAIKNLSTPALILRLLHLKISYIYKIAFGDLAFLAICALILLEVTGRSIKFKNYLKVIAYAIPIFNLLILIYFKQSLSTNVSWEYGVVYLTLALLTLPVKINLQALEKLGYFGKLSYAIYVFHFPIAVIINAILSKYLSGIPFFLTGFIVWATVTIALSAFAETIMQPYLKKVFLGSKNEIKLIASSKSV